MSGVATAGSDAAGEMARLREAVARVRELRGRTPTAAGAGRPEAPEIAIVLGTGLGGLASKIDADVEIPYADVPHLPPATVEGHEGRLVLGTLEGARVVAMQGRPHRYEGHSFLEVARPVRVMGLLGARTLIASCACGGMNPLWDKGDLVVLDDHVNLMGGSPLTGPNLDELGPRFPDMSQPYDPALQNLARRAGLEAGLSLRRGVYVGVAGPQLETRAEYRMLRSAGADAVGMSTVAETIAARHMGMRVLALAVVTDMCLPDSLEPVDVADVVATAQAAEPALARVVRAVAKALGRGAAPDASEDSAETV